MQDQANLSLQRVSEVSNIFVNTQAEAKERGLFYKSPQPPDGKCKFCGKTLHHRGLIFTGRYVLWQPDLERCDCDKAKEKWITYDAEQKKLKAEAEKERQRKIEQSQIDRLLCQSGIKKRFKQRTFENFVCDTPERERCYKIAKDYADGFQRHFEDGSGLYFEGTNGTGKTHLAAAIALQLMTKDHIPVICKTSGDLLLDIKKSFDSDDVTEAQIIKTYKDVDLLIIDDLGKEQCSDWSISTLYSILNDRYEDMRPTIITTNYNSDDLVRALTPKGYYSSKIIAIISRLREVNKVVTMAWEDRRGVQNLESKQ